jgi:uncharacterized membrane protein YozB (DUF420 family)
MAYFVKYTTYTSLQRNKTLNNCSFSVKQRYVMILILYIVLLDFSRTMCFLNIILNFHVILDEKFPVRGIIIRTLHEIPLG